MGQSTGSTSIAASSWLAASLFGEAGRLLPSEIRDEGGNAYPITVTSSSERASVLHSCGQCAPSVLPVRFIPIWPICTMSSLPDCDQCTAPNYKGG